MIARSSNALTLAFTVRHSLATRMTLLEVVNEEGTLPAFSVRFVSQVSRLVDSVVQRGLMRAADLHGKRCNAGAGRRAMEATLPMVPECVQGARGSNGT
jgi:hypothetical protein